MFAFSQLTPHFPLLPYCFFPSRGRGRGTISTPYSPLPLPLSTITSAATSSYQRQTIACTFQPIACRASAIGRPACVWQCYGTAGRRQRRGVAEGGEKKESDAKAKRNITSRNFMCNREGFVFLPPERAFHHRTGRLEP